MGLPFLVAALALMAAPTIFWTGTSGGIGLKWSDHDLIATIDGKRTSLFHEPGLKEVEDNSGDGMDATVQDSLLSVVGSYVSYEHSESECGEGHCAGHVAYETIDLKKQRRRVSLTEFFAEPDLMKALTQDAVVADALAKAGKTRPTSFATLQKALGDLEVQVQGETYLTADFATSFCFHHLEKGKVAVRINLPLKDSVGPMMNVELGLLLPIPPQLADALRAASERRSGILAGALQKLAPQAETITSASE
jgi:hypothetical protein